MKKIFGILFCVLLIANSAKSQSKYGADSVNCVTNLSLYTEYYKQKNYDDAIKSWRWVYNNCPSASSNIFKRGPKLIKHLMKKNPENKQAYIDTLMIIFDKRIQYFGKQGYVLGLKGYELVILDKNRSEEALEYLKTSIDLDGNKASVQAIYGYMLAIVNLEKSGVKQKVDVLNAYAIVSEIIDYNIVNKTKATKYYVQYSEKVEDLFTPYANCDDLISLFSDKFEPTTEDVNFLKRITKVLDNKDCTNSDLFFNASSRLHELAPSAASASKMAKMNVSKNKYSDAINYFKQAIELEEQDKTKARYYLELADAYRISGSFSSARSSAYKSAELRPDWGEPFISIANIYATSVKKCGSTDFEQATVYWLVVDKFIKAKSIDASVTDKANKSIATYSKIFPNTEMCFFNGIESGQTYLVECWINEKTRVRTRD